MQIGAAVAMLAGVVSAPSAVAQTVDPAPVVDPVTVVGPGLSYETTGFGALPQRAHIATIDLARYDVGAAVGYDTLGGYRSSTQATSSMCDRTACRAAVNGDFFDPWGTPEGDLVIAGRPLLVDGKASRPKVIANEDEAWITADPLGLKVTLAAGTAEIGATSVNRVPGPDRIAVYTIDGGTTTPTFDDDLTAILVASTMVPPAIGSSLTTKGSQIRAVEPSDTSLAAGLLFVANGDAQMALFELLSAAAAAPGGSVTMSTDASFDATTVISGDVVLREDDQSKVQVDNPAVTKSRNPRTLAAVTDDGDLMFATIDGRSATAAGATLQEAEALLAGRGATAIINLDGGGSTTFVVDGDIVNRPSDGGERSVANALVVVDEGSRVSAPAPPAARRRFSYPRR